MRTTCCCVILFLSFLAAVFAKSWSSQIAAGGSVAPVKPSDSLFQKTRRAPEQEEALFVVKRDGSREVFDQEKVSFLEMNITEF